MSDPRKHMGPEVLNAVCYLTVNRKLWVEGDLIAGHVIQEIMNEERAARDRGRRLERERQQRQEADRRDAASASASASDDDM